MREGSHISVEIQHFLVGQDARYGRNIHRRGCISVTRYVGLVGEREIKGEGEEGGNDGW